MDLFINGSLLNQGPINAVRSRSYLYREIYLGFTSPLLQSLTGPRPSKTAWTPNRACRLASRAGPGVPGVPRDGDGHSCLSPR